MSRRIPVRPPSAREQHGNPHTDDLSHVLPIADRGLGAHQEAADRVPMALIAGRYSESCSRLLTTTKLDSW
jgi:hypothetical protein